MSNRRALGARRPVIAAALVCMWAAAAVAQDASPQDVQADGTFTAYGYLTDNLSWSEGYSGDALPTLEAKGVFDVGERGALALVVANPAPVSALVRINCQLTVTKPDGAVRRYDPTLCHYGPIGPAGVFYPSQTTIYFAVGENDLDGLTRFDLDVTDLHSDRSVTLSLSYAKGGAQ